MKVFKIFFKQLFCRHNYSKFIYSHDKRFAFSTCCKCNHQITIDSKGKV